MIEKIKLSFGYGLLTAGVGGTETNWRDHLLSSSIVRCQKAKVPGFDPATSHAELITSPMGQTLGIRWRTRLRQNGLSDYIGSRVIIARLEDPLSHDEYVAAWKLAAMDKLIGRVYPVHRILMMGLTSWVLPGWLDQLNLFEHWAMCSEGVARFYRAVRLVRLKSHGPNYLRYFERGWKGIMPAHLEQIYTGSDEFAVVFNGVLTAPILKFSGLPTHRYPNGEKVDLVKND